MSHIANQEGFCHEAYENHKSPNPLSHHVLFLLLTELFIGIFVHDRFIRPYAGDVLVVILIYTFLRALFPHGVKNLVWYVLLFAVSVEILQYFHIGRLLGLEHNRAAMIILGSTFDVKDILCYAAGCLIILVWEQPGRRKL